MIKKKTKRKSQ